MPNIVQPPITDVIKKSVLTTTGDIIQQGVASPEVLHIGNDKEILRKDQVSGKLLYVNQGLIFNENLYKYKSTVSLTVTAGSSSTGYLGSITLKSGDLVLISYYLAGSFASSDSRIFIEPSLKKTTVPHTAGTLHYDKSTESMQYKTVTGATGLYICNTLLGQVSSDGDYCLSMYYHNVDTDFTVAAGDFQYVILPIFKQ